MLFVIGMFLFSITFVVNLTADLVDPRRQSLMGQFSVTARAASCALSPAERSRECVFGTMTACLVDPAGRDHRDDDRPRRAGAELLAFLFDNPTNGMTAGGIWSALVGTL